MQKTKHFNFAKHVFEINRQRGHKVAFVDDETQITYQELEQRARSFCLHLHQLGLKKEDRVLIATTDCVKVPVAILGCILGGYVFVPCNARGSKITLAKYLEICSPQVIITCAENHDTVSDLVNELCLNPKKIINKDDLAIYYKDTTLFDPPTTVRDSAAYWFFTSGGSGEPKAVVHAHGAMFEQGTGLSQAYQMTSDDVMYNTSKLSWTYGITYNFYSVLLTGACGILREKLPTPQSIVETIKNLKPTMFASIPGIYTAMLNSGLDLSELGLKCCFSGGELLPIHIIQQWHSATNTNLYDIYGTTETGGVALSNRDGVHKLGTTGKPIPGYSVEVRNTNGDVCDINEIGELYIKSPSLGIWYYNDLEKSQQSFQGQWFKTGDKFIKDSEGFFKFTGRTNDMFRVNASWISPVEIENVLVENQLILEAGVTGKEDSNGLMQVAAFVVIKPGTVVPDNLDHQLKRLVQKKLEHVKTPKFIKIIESLPKNENGKIQRYLLKNL
jgi:benzoate-CoA ligase